MMVSRGAGAVLAVLLLSHCSLQQAPAKKRPLKKDPPRDAAVMELQKQIEEIIQELNLLKEQQALQTVCLKGLKAVGKCFLAEPARKRYHAASEDCGALGGVLATPTSDPENQQLRDYVLQSVGPDGRVWLGINDMAAEGAWVDHTGSNITYKNWDTSSSGAPQPDGGRSQNCAVLALDSQGKWTDEDCRDERASVCQFNIV